MWIMLVLFPFLSFSEDMSSEKYCFSLLAQIAINKISGILVPSDTVTTDGQCLVIQMRPHRRELIQRYILSEVPGASISFSSAQIKRDPCKIKVEKIKKETSKDLSVAVNVKTPSAQASDQQGSSKHVMLIETLGKFTFTVDQDEIVGNCRYIRPSLYEISLEVRKNLKPPLPGTIILNQPPPTDQETMVLTTVVQISSGQKIEIGQIVKGLEEKNHEVTLNPNLHLQKLKRDYSESVFLSLQ